MDEYKERSKTASSVIVGQVCFIDKKHLTKTKKLKGIIFINWILKITSQV